jgi:general secretion pathway protein M
VTPAALPTGKRGQILALALALVALAGAYLLIAAPLLDFYAERAALIQTRRTLLARLDAIAGRLPELRARLGRLQTAAPDRNITLEGPSDAVALATLQSRVEELASVADVAIGSSEGLPAETRGDYRRIGLHLVFSGPYDRVVTLLSKLDAATPPFILDDLQIHGPTGRTEPGQAASLGAGVDIYAFRANETASAAKP